MIVAVCGLDQLVVPVHRLLWLSSPTAARHLWPHLSQVKRESGGVAVLRSLFCLRLSSQALSCFDTYLQMVILHKLDASPPARACMMACELFNVPVEMVDVNILGGDHLKPEYLKKNPLHTVPMLEDGSLVIHDSHAILMYLADVYGKDESFYPTDPKQRALVNQKLFFNTSILFPRMRNITFPLIIEGNKNIPQKSFDAIEEAYHFMEEFLSRSKYLAGDNITIADIAAYSTVTSLDLLLELNAQKFPKTQAWLKVLEKLPYVQKGNAKGVADLKHFIDSHLA